MKKKITLSEQFQNPIEKSWKETKFIFLTHIQDHSFSWFGTGTSIKSGRIKQDLF
jgi:hypothetical protein